MARYHEWLRRYGAGGLGWGDVWADVSAHPAVARLQTIPRPHLERLADSGVTFRITGSLLLDVIHAAGGVEYTVEKLLTALEVVQQWTDERSVPGGPLEYKVVPERWDVSFEVSNLVVWARTLVERLETKVPGRDVRIGLLPALADGDLKDQVKRFHDELARWVEAESWLATRCTLEGCTVAGRSSTVDRTVGLGSRCRIGRGARSGHRRSSPIARIGTPKRSRSIYLLEWSASWMGCSPVSSSMRDSGFNRSRDRLELAGASPSRELARSGPAACSPPSATR